MASLRNVLLAVLVVAGIAVPVSSSAAAGGDVVESARTADAPRVLRYHGATRADTAALVAAETFAHADVVVIARQDGFADSLGGGFLAGQLDAPIVLTDGKNLSPEAARVVEQLQPSRAVVLGGEAAVGPAVMQRLRDLGLEVTRIGGSDRYATGAAVATHPGTEVGTLDGRRTAILASGRNFPDALAMSALAYARGWPLLLTDPVALTPATADVLAELDVDHVLVAGGLGAVSRDVMDAVEAQGMSTERLSGDTRIDTALAIARFAVDRAGFDSTVVNIATGAAFPDALAFGPRAGSDPSPVLLVGGVDELGSAALAQHLDALSCVRLLRVSGGPAAVGDELLDAVRGRLRPCGDDEVSVGGAEDPGSSGGAGSSGSGSAAPTDPSGPPPEAPVTPPSTPPTTTPSADRVLRGDVALESGFTVPAGEVWIFDPDVTTTVTVGGNVVVRGRLEMRPSSDAVAHTLRFEGIDEREAVGGHTDVPLDSDVGLWVTGDGQLDLRGTPRAGWNRTGVDPSWRRDDVLVAAPQAMDEYRTFLDFEAGSAVPTVLGPDGTQHPTEVANLTRNVRILGGGSNPPDVLTENGRAHITMLHCNQPQVVMDVELRWLGPRASHQRDGTDGLVGRYPFHLHKCGDGSRGTIVDGVVVRDSGNRAFVPHASHGVTLHDTVAFNVWETPYWYDEGEGNETRDLLIDHAAAFKVSDWPRKRGYSLAGFELGRGTGNVVRGSVVAGVLNTTNNSGGFLWPSHANTSDNVWDFHDNVTHNNRGAGIGVWQNDWNDHLIERFVSYRNGEGLRHGAYLNSYHYRDGVSFDEDVSVHALGGIRFERMQIGGNIRIKEHQLDSGGTTLWCDLDLGGRVIIDESDKGGNIRFHSTDPAFDLSPEDFTVRSRTSTIVVERADGSTFEVR